MKKASFLCCVLTLTQLAFSQAVFKGIVCEDSSAQSPLFQAQVFVLANGAEVLKLSSDFDGTFGIKTAKNTFYSVKVVYPGCKEVSLEFQTDKKGNPTPATAIFVMKKDGLRLVGKVLDAITKMPIERADVILKDIQTREEIRFTTGKDGSYNLKLRYETNYRVSIDKRSPGIVNRYEDTVFFVSTLGFNQPLDYALDIVLRPAQQLTNRTEYAPIPNKPASKPIIEVKPTLKPDGLASDLQEPKNAAQSFEDKQALNHREFKEINTDQIAKNKKESLKEKTTKQQESTESKENVDAKSGTAKNEIDDSFENLSKKKQRQKNLRPQKDIAIKKKVQEDKTNAPNFRNDPALKQANSQIQEPQPKSPSASAFQNTQKVDSAKLQVESSVSGKNLIKSPLVKIATTIYFVKNASFITEFSKSKLKQVIDEMKKDTTRQLLLSVHASSDEQNAEMLCQTRLVAVKQFLVQNGISLERVAEKLNGNTVPVNDCHITNDCPEQKWILNRRLEVIWK